MRGPTVTTAAGGLGFQSVTCPAGFVAISAEQVNSGSTGVSTNEAFVNGGSGGVFLSNASAVPVTWHAYAVCANGTVIGSSARATEGGAK